MIQKVYTSCCTLNQMVCDNETSMRELKKFVRDAQRESLYNLSEYRQGGAKALFCMTAPHEPPLERKLIQLGFEHIRTINRRNGYAPGKVKMWILNW